MSGTDRVTFSIISVYNDPDVLSDWLLGTLEEQSFDDYETVLVDNTGDEHSSAADALNHGAEQANGEYYVFVHQDVRFPSPNFLSDLRSSVEDLSSFGIAGLAGAKSTGRNYAQREVVNIYQGPDRERMHTNVSNLPERVSTLDELFFMIPGEVFERRQLNSRICDGWHLYAVEYCLWIAEETNLNSYILPIEGWHQSPGMTIRSDFYETILAVAREYPEVNWINTTTGLWIGSPRYLSILYSISRGVELLPESIGEPLLEKLRDFAAFILPMLIEDPVGSFRLAF